MSWPAFIRVFVSVALTFGLAVFAFILVLDPYQNVPFSPDLPRAPISQNQRFAYPAVARDPAFDSVIIGTSTARLIDPAALDGAGGAHFANLAMNSATAYEQMRMHELFVRHHPDMRYLVLALDKTWCNREAEIERYTFRRFPEWLYDENPWNDLLYLFNDKALENAVRMFEFLGGRREPRYGRNGYRDFTEDFGVWQRDEVLPRLYPRSTAQHKLTPDAVSPSLENPQWPFPLHDDLARLLAATPSEARVVFFFPPLHARYVTANLDVFKECKGRLAAIAAADGRTAILDYLMLSPLTMDDTNYWDPLHFTRRLSVRIQRDLITLLSGRAPKAADLRYIPARRPASTSTVRDLERSDGSP